MRLEPTSPDHHGWKVYQVGCSCPERNDSIDAWCCDACPDPGNPEDPSWSAVPVDADGDEIDLSPQARADIVSKVRRHGYTARSLAETERLMGDRIRALESELAEANARYWRAVKSEADPTEGAPTR